MMRPVLHGDVTSAARALLCRPETERADFCKSLIRTAHLADQHLARTGRVHVMWGNGSLMASARAFPMKPEPTLDSDDYCSCLEMVLLALVNWRASQKRN